MGLLAVCCAKNGHPARTEELAGGPVLKLPRGCLRRCGRCSACRRVDRSVCGGSKGFGRSRRNTKLLLKRKDSHDFSGKMRYTHFNRIRDTTHWGEQS